MQLAGLLDDALLAAATTPTTDVVVGTGQLPHPGAFAVTLASLGGHTSLAALAGGLPDEADGTPPGGGDPSGSVVPGAADGVPLLAGLSAGEAAAAAAGGPSGADGAVSTVGPATGTATTVAAPAPTGTAAIALVPVDDGAAGAPGSAAAPGAVPPRHEVAGVLQQGADVARPAGVAQPAADAPAGVAQPAAGTAGAAALSGTRPQTPSGRVGTAAGEAQERGAGADTPTSSRPAAPLAPAGAPGAAGPGQPPDGTRAPGTGEESKLPSGPAASAAGGTDARAAERPVAVTRTFVAGGGATTADAGSDVSADEHGAGSRHDPAGSGRSPLIELAARAGATAGAAAAPPTLAPAAPALEASPGPSAPTLQPAPVVSSAEGGTPDAAPVRAGLAPAPPTVPTPPWAQRVADGVQFSAVRGGSEIRLQLEPEGLGYIDIRVHLGADGVRAVIVAEHEATRALLANQQHVLETALERTDLRLAGFSVDVGQEHRSDLARPRAELPAEAGPEAPAAPSDADRTAHQLLAEPGRLNVRA